MGIFSKLFGSRDESKVDKKTIYYDWSLGDNQYWSKDRFSEYLTNVELKMLFRLLDYKFAYGLTITYNISTTLNLNLVARYLIKKAKRRIQLVINDINTSIFRFDKIFSELDSASDMTSINIFSENDLSDKYKNLCEYSGGKFTRITGSEDDILVIDDSAYLVIIKDKSSEYIGRLCIYPEGELNMNKILSCLNKLI